MICFLFSVGFLFCFNSFLFLFWAASCQVDTQLCNCWQLGTLRSRGMPQADDDDNAPNRKTE